MKDLYDTIDNFKFKINIIKDIFDRIINIFDSYYKINSDIIHNYDIKKRNYYILQNLQNLKNNNEEVIKYLNNIINNNNNIFEIYKFPNEKFFYNEYYGLYFIEMKIISRREKEYYILIKQKNLIVLKMVILMIRI